MAHAPSDERLLLATRRELAQHDIKDRGEEKPEEGHAEHPSEYSDAHDMAHFGTGAKWTIPMSGGNVTQSWFNLYSSASELGDFQ